MSNYRQFEALMKEKEQLEELISNESISTLFQPIVDLKDRSIIGYEALSRGPEGYENPAKLFSAASETNLTFELDCLCRRKALENARGLDSKLKLFLNCTPTAVLDSSFRDITLAALLRELKIKPHNLVIEITEREAIENYSLHREAMAHYSRAGFQIAVDDTGSGYSSLETVIELKPQYIKIDMSITRGIGSNVMKQELLTAMLALGAKMDSQIIVEGIETEEELDTVKKLGVTLAQGYLLARPAPPFPGLSSYPSTWKSR